MGAFVDREEENLQRKQCEQCQETKNIDRFRKVTNMHTSVHYMNLCKDCYNHNQEKRRQQQEDEWEAGREERARRLAQPPVCHDCGSAYVPWGEAWDNFYCQPCHIKHFAHSPRQICCVCGEQKLYLDFPHQHQGYALRRDGANIYLYCHACEKDPAPRYV